MSNASAIQTVAVKRFQCRHIFTDGHRCGSPCLRREQFCYYHHATRNIVADPHQRRARINILDLPMPEDRAALLLSIGEVLQCIGSKIIDPKRAALMLYGLQIANSVLPRERTTASGPVRASSRTQPRRSIREAPVEETVYDDELGIIATPAEFLEPEKKPREKEEKKECKSLAHQLAEEEEADAPEDRECELKLQEWLRKEVEAAVAAARAEAIAETEARLRAEFNQPQPATVPVIQAVADPQSTADGRTLVLPVVPNFVCHSNRSRRLCKSSSFRSTVKQRTYQLVKQRADRFIEKHALLETRLA